MILSLFNGIYTVRKLEIKMIRMEPIRKNRVVKKILFYFSNHSKNKIEVFWLTLNFLKRVSRNYFQYIFIKSIHVLKLNKLIEKVITSGKSFVPIKKIM